jgi:hypothetical protein
VFLLAVRPRSRFYDFWSELLEELHQAINQSTAAANHMQTAFMLMLFQNLVQTAFQIHHVPYLLTLVQTPSWAYFPQVKMI